MNDNKLQQFVTELKSNIANLVKLQEQQQTDKPQMQKEIHLLAESTAQRVANDLVEHISQQTGEFRRSINNLVDTLMQQFDLADSKAFDGISLSPLKTYDENLREFRKIFDELADVCKTLDGIDFDKLDPPVNYTMENVLSDEYQARDDKASYLAVRSQIDKDYSERLLKLCFEALYRLDRLEEFYVTEGKFGEYKTEITALENRLYDEYLEKEEARWNKALKEKLLLDYDIFHDFDEWKQESSPDMKNGSLAFKDKIYLGDKNTPLIRKDMAEVDKRIISYSDTLQARVNDGYLKSPFVLDLQTSPHLFINVSNSELRESTINFVHEYIQTILMSQPSGRVTMCLIDCNDQCKFNRYAALKNISQNALYKGIIRNERDVESVLDDMESTMFDIGDNKLSVANASNVFEFNKISVENPQNLHIMVLMDFPEKYTPESLGHIAKIVSSGTDCGIFTLIVNNTQANVDYGHRKQMIEDTISQIKRNCMILHEKHDGTFVFDSSFSRTSRDYPTTLTPSKICTSHIFKDHLYPVLEENAKAQIDTVISLAPFFELSRKYREVDTKDNDFSRLLEIPIGKNGGEVQCLRFFTDSGNAHALVIGGTGSGKSNLLHTIIISACYRYSPDELQIYLVDFKGGVEFKFYQANKVVEKQLPHIRLTGLTSEPEDGVAILTNIRRILRDRETLFRKNDVEDIIQYNKKRDVGEKLPRMLIIIDEVQELMTDQKLAEQALDIFGELFKKGRAFGISILWASQTVPKGVAGFKDKVLSQISNRICLKVNNSADAADLGIDEKKIRLLNRPEKGLGIIFDGLNETEFRVAYAESRENRFEYVREINEHWNIKQKTPLFIVGDDEVPSPAEGDNIFNRRPASAPKSIGTYHACLGQNYITGDPYNIEFTQESGEHCWIAGDDKEALQDIIGYSLLSMLIEHKTNTDVANSEPVKFYCYNDKLMNDNRDLYFTLPEKFPELIEVVNKANIADVLVELYRIRKARSSGASSSDTPIYFFIHQFQSLAENFEKTDVKYAVQEETTSAATSSVDYAEMDKLIASGEFSGSLSLSGSFGGGSSSGSRLTFAQIFNELLHYGAEAGIHLIMTMDTPTAVPEVRTELAKAAHKIVLAGVPRDAVSRFVDMPYIRDLVPKKGQQVAFYYDNTSLQKFKVYRYDPDNMSQVKWLDTVTKFD